VPFGTTKIILARLEAIEALAGDLSQRLDRLAVASSQARDEAGVRQDALRESIRPVLDAMDRRLSTIEARLSAVGEEGPVQGSLAKTGERLTGLLEAERVTATAVEGAQADTAALREELTQLRSAQDLSARSTATALEHLKGHVSDGVRRIEAQIDPLARNEDLAQAVERMRVIGQGIGAMRDQLKQDREAATAALSSWEQEMRGLREDLKPISEESRQWQKKTADAIHNDLATVKTALTSDRDENKRLATSVQYAEADLRKALEGAEEKLVDVLAGRLDRDMGRLGGLLDSLQRMANLLEARGVSPFKTAKSKILQHLKRKDNMGGKHTPWDKALESLSPTEREYGDEALQELIRDGLVVRKPGTGDLHVFLDYRRMKDIDRVINGEELGAPP
jgi:chromosome segregation ATPase